MKDEILDVLQSYMQGRNNDFHAAMEQIETKFGQNGLDKVNKLLSTFPKQYENCTDVIYQLLTTVLEARVYGEGLYPNPAEYDLIMSIRNIEVKDHWR